MNDKERFDACMEIVKYASNNFHGRRNFEWKVTLGYWALLAAAITFVKQDPTWMAQRPYLLWFAPASVIGFMILWLRGVWVAQADEKALRNQFLFEADEIIHDPTYMPKKIPSRISISDYRWFIGFLGDWSAWFQIITTAFLALIFYLAAHP